MALAPKLEFRQSQQLVMTPQLQQAIKLLQLSNLELADYVEQQLEENPFLERAAEEGSREEPAEAATAPAAAAEEQIDLARDDIAEKAHDAVDAEDDGAAAREGQDFRVNEWASVGKGGVGDDDREFGATLSRDISLWDHLNEQLQVATRDPEKLFIGAYIIDLIDEQGYLRESVEAIADRLGAGAADVEAALSLIQTFDPSGVGARSLKECLRIQLAERGRLDPVMSAFLDNIERLAQGDLKGLMRATGADEDDVRDMIAEVRSLTPKPGLGFGGGEPAQIVRPDVFVTAAEDGGWKIELNSDTLPRVLVNQAYYAKVSKAKAKDTDKQFVSDQFASANWLAKSLDQRARTILKVASEIVRQQDAFFLYGVKHLRPLNLTVVADAISMHESTVSRVTSNKYMATPRGLFEMKYFFTAS
ncbi:MAG: RNA polymerase factor sigma-54, partial [Parvularculaceae bacterium]|nr:RNA polymerase factor sigma-54 [Parvularculaceae bacterium]